MNDNELSERMKALARPLIETVTDFLLNNEGAAIDDLIGILISAHLTSLYYSLQEISKDDEETRSLVNEIVETMEEALKSYLVGFESA